MTDVDRAKLVARAATIIGGQRATADALSVSERSVRYWIAGDRPVGDGVLVDLIEVLDQIADGAATLSETLQAEVPDYERPNRG